MDRVSDRTDALVVQYHGMFGKSGFTVRRLEPLSTWKEAVVYHPEQGTLVVADALGTSAGFRSATNGLASHFQSDSSHRAPSLVTCNHSESCSGTERACLTTPQSLSTMHLLAHGNGFHVHSQRNSAFT